MRGQTAQKLKLAEQYRLAREGDVARRLSMVPIKVPPGGPLPPPPRVVGGVRLGGGLPPRPLPPPHHLHKPYHHHGLISPHYTTTCFKHHYWGHAFFAGTCWYPRWDTWVHWSWHVHCPPRWDPRPIYCRPVIYDPCPRWVYWPVPVFVPLPVVSCGTWVDVRTKVIADGHDLQLLAVRQVDAGHPEQKLGPRYRVWVRNNSTRSVAAPFSVMLFASSDGKLRADSPQAGVRITSLAAEQMQAVDIRLPSTVYGMTQDAEGNPLPFAILHVLVDAHREAADTDLTNNGANIRREEILPVDPAAFTIDPATAAAGEPVTVAGEGFGPQPGQVLIHLGGLELEGEILGWYELGVRFNLPKVPLAGANEAEVIVVRSDGAAANPLKLTVAPARPLPFLPPPGPN